VRSALKRPLHPTNAAPELARVLARLLPRHAELATAPGLTVTVEDLVENSDLRAHLAEESFSRRLAWHLDELTGTPRVPRTLHIGYARGESSAVMIEPFSGRAHAARLEWSGGVFAIDGTKSLLAAGRGPLRKRFPGARNDVVLADALTFVSRDAFALRWDPARVAWRLEIDETGRAFVEIQRRGSVLFPQLGSIPLETGDVIVLTAGPGSRDRLEIQFV
jgi:hypothetical protein